MGLSRIFTCGAPMMGDIFIDKLTEKHRLRLEKKMKRLADKVKKLRPYRSMSFKVNMIFGMAKMQHKAVLKTEETPSLDNAHYLKHGWIKQ